MQRCVLAGLVVLPLILVAGCPYVTSPVELEARVKTSLGEFVIELDPEHAPITAANFAQYAYDGFYDGTIFHRVIPDFVIQGGGLTTDLAAKETRTPIANESPGGLSNVRGTVAMARTADPDSATAQFFVNVADNPELDADGDQPGYTVFGRVIEGLEVVDQIAAVLTEERDGLADVPVEDVLIEQIELIERSAAGLELTPSGEAYVESAGFEALSLARELLVQILSFMLNPG